MATKDIHLSLLLRIDRLLAEAEAVRELRDRLLAATRLNDQSQQSESGKAAQHGR